MIEPDEMYALVVCDVSSPLAVLLVSSELVTQGVLTTAMDAAEEDDRFVTQLSPTVCHSAAEVHQCIQRIEEIQGDQPSPGKPPA